MWDAENPGGGKDLFYAHGLWEHDMQRGGR
jgi:hypothetical protein